MTRKSQHPDRMIFDYLGGRLEEKEQSLVEKHLLECEECSAAASMTRGLKAGAEEIKRDLAASHPEINQLAEFFYNKSSGAESRSTAAHVALCPDCADDIALYARAEHAATGFDPAQVTRGEVPQSAWAAIREWEESAYAKTKTENYQSSQDVLVRLAGVLISQEERLKELAEEARPSIKCAESDLVPVIIVDKSARIRGVTMFEQTSSGAGESVLKPLTEAERFESKSFHVLLDFGEENLVMVSDVVRHSTIRLQRVTRADTALRRIDYFIVED